MQLFQEVKISEGWLPEGEVVVGVTSGSSTPDKAVEDIINQILVIEVSCCELNISLFGLRKFREGVCYWQNLNCLLLV